MARPGDTIYLVVGRQTPGGAGSTGKVAADFVFAPTLDGVVTTPVTTATEVSTVGNVPNQWTQYKIAVTLSSTAGRFSERVMPAGGFDVISPDVFQGEIEAYDVDALAALMLTSQGVPAVTSAADNDLGDIVDGDAYTSATLTVPLGKLTPLGQSDLTALTIRAAIMATPGGTQYNITATIVSAVGLTFNFNWPGGASQPHPALTTENSKPWFLDVQLIKSATLIATTNRYTFTQQWQRDTRTA